MPPPAHGKGRCWYIDNPRIWRCPLRPEGGEAGRISPPPCPCRQSSGISPRLRAVPPQCVLCLQCTFRHRLTAPYRYIPPACAVPMQARYSGSPPICPLPYPAGCACSGRTCGGHFRLWVYVYTPRRVSPDRGDRPARFRFAYRILRQCCPALQYLYPQAATKLLSESAAPASRIRSLLLFRPYPEGWGSLLFFPSIPHRNTCIAPLRTRVCCGARKRQRCPSPCPLRRQGIPPRMQAAAPV